MDKVAIHSVPRSGSTWLGNIFNSHPDVIFKYQPLFSYAFKNFLTENSTSNEINSFFDKISASQDYFLDQTEGIKKGLVPKFHKNNEFTHICYKEVRYHNILVNMLKNSSDIKFIFLIRNPLAVLFSWKNAPKEFRADKGWSFDDEWKNANSKNLNQPEEYNGYVKWKEATHLFLSLKKKYPNKVYILEYNDLLNQRDLKIKEIFKFVKLPFNKQTINFLKMSTSQNNKDFYSVFKIKESDNDWINLPEYIIDYVHQDLKGTILERFLKSTK